MKNTVLVSAAILFSIAASGQWTAGMNDDAGKAAATSSADLPAADFTGMRHIYPKRDRLFTISLDGTWAFRLVKPEVLSEAGGETNKTYRLRWVIDGDKENFIEGDVVVLDIRHATSDTRSGLSPVESRVSDVSYDLRPSVKCASDARFAELGLALFAEGDRVDWLGDGPLTSVPGKSKMNVFGKWTMHNDDYRFAGNRSNVKWASVGSNGSVAQPLVVESGTGNISFENVDGRICITENLAVAGYGGKASGPGSLKSPKEINMKGSFTIYAAEMGAPPPDVVPDLTYTHHYGF